MPAFDRTGPQGAGPMTGRAMGPCANRRGVGQGFGFGFGRGGRRGLGRYFCGNQTWSKTDMEEYKKALKEELEDVDKELEADNKK